MANCKALTGSAMKGLIVHIFSESFHYGNVDKGSQTYKDGTNIATQWDERLS